MADNLPIIFSSHALIKLEQRSLTKEMIIEVVQKPEYITTVRGQLHAFKKFRKLYLKVIFTRTENSIIVITQHWVRKLP